MAAGAVGLTAAKVGEAELMAEVADDILLAYPAIDPARTARLAHLAGACHGARGRRFAAQGPSCWARRPIASRATIGILVDLDVGMGRTGVQTPSEALKLAQFVDATPGLRLDGLFCYPGHIGGPADQQRPPCKRSPTSWPRRCSCGPITGCRPGSSRAARPRRPIQSHLVPEYTEIRPGTYVYNDMNTVRGGYCTLDDCAARIICTVVSTAVPGQVVIDAGSKTLTSDRCGPRPTAATATSSSIPRPGSRGSAKSTARSMFAPASATPQARRAGDRDPQPHLPLRQPAGRRLVARRGGPTAGAADRRPRAVGL